MKLENILVPVDFSDCSNNALHYAIELAKKAGAKLTLLNCYTVHIPAADITVDIYPTLAIEHQKSAEDNFSRLRETAPDLDKVAHEELIKVSSIRNGVLEIAEEIKADLIVMGTKGADNRIDEFFGSNTYRTIKKSKTPVLAIPEEAKFIPLQKILFAADFKHVAEVHGLDIVKTIGNLYKATVEILHVGHDWSELNMHQTEEAAAILAFFGHTEHSCHFIKEEIDVEQAIDDHLEKHQNELLVLIARKHHFPGALFKRKITRSTVMHTDLPLLTIPDVE